MPKSAPNSDDRQARLAAALRANLKRRKAQSRQKDRAQAEDGADGAAEGADGLPGERPNLAQKPG